MHKGKSIHPEFQLHLEGFNFSAGLVTLAAVRSGLKVVIEMNEPIKKDFAPELSHFYPTSISQMRKSYFDVQFLLKCSSLFPHLYFPKRVLFLQTNANLNYGLCAAFDQLLERDRESSSLPLKPEKFKDYAVMSSSCEQGALVFEYQFDSNRATIELLRKCVDEGAILIRPGELVKAKTILKCQSYQSKNDSIFMEISYPYPNPVRLKTAAYELILLGVASGTILQIHCTTRVSNKEILFQELVTSLRQLHIAPPENLKVRLQEIDFPTTAVNNVIESEIIDVPLADLRKKVIQLQHRMEAELGVKINLKKLFNEFPVHAISGENFRLIQTECDEKFDLAKQTGIEYKVFTHLFYRYRSYIDSMIEQAYELMNTERNPQIIWENVETEFLRNEYKMLFSRDLS